jgi:putative ABC transport system permease protein
MSMSIYQPYHYFSPRALALVVHTEQDPLSAVPSIRALIRTIDADVPVFDVQTMKEIEYRCLWRQRLSSWLLGIFSALALTLASIGIYGVVAFSVSRRYHELGVRFALGAERKDILRMIFEQGASLLAVGLSLGLAGAIIVTKALTSVLYVQGWELSTYVLVLLTIASTSLLASYVPARRASKIDPSTMLRYQ